MTKVPGNNAAPIGNSSDCSYEGMVADRGGTDPYQSPIAAFERNVQLAFGGDAGMSGEAHEHWAGNRVIRDRIIGKAGVAHTDHQIAQCSDIALTFDDGPSDPDTLRLLEILERYGVRATFFMIGRNVRRRPDIAEKVARAGHVIGNHTFTHPNLAFCSRAQVREEVEACERALTDAVGEHSRLFRPPHGGRRPGVLWTIRRAGLVPVLWSVTGYDWNSSPAGEIEAGIVHQIRGDEIVLLHDGSHLELSSNRAQTLLAAGNLIRLYQQQGWRFVTVPEMMGKKLGISSWRNRLRWVKYRYW